MWADAITKYMKNIRVAFDIREKGDPPPVGHQFIKFHMIFDEDGGLAAEGKDG